MFPDLNLILIFILTYLTIFSLYFIRERNSFFFITINLLVYIEGFYFVSPNSFWNLVLFLVHNYQYVLIYLFIGLFWAALDWTTFVKTRTKHYLSLRKKWLLSNKLSDGKVPENMKIEWFRFLLSQKEWCYNGSISIVPKENQRFFSSFLYWPISVTRRVFDLVFYVFAWVGKLNFAYNFVSYSRLRDFEQDITVEQ